MEPPEVRYARTVDGVNIAYQVRGDGPVDLVYTLGMAGNFEIEFEAPWGIRFLERLATFSRVILFDKRGTGLSDRVPINELPTLEQRMDDVRAVMDAADSGRAALFGKRRLKLTFLPSRKRSSPVSLTSGRECVASGKGHVAPMS